MYSWSFENQLIQIEAPDDVVTTQTYAPVNRKADELRIARETESGIVNFVWDDQNIIREVDETSTIEAEYTLNPQPYGNLVSQRRENESTFYNYDALGSTESLTNQSGTVNNEYTYLAFGKITSQTGSTENPYTWVGELGYYQNPDGSFTLRRREFTPEENRFRSEDPIQADEDNLYRYVNNSPLNSVDPSGLEGQTCSIPDDEIPDELKPKRDTSNPSSSIPPYCSIDQSGQLRFVQFANSYTIGSVITCSGAQWVQRGGQYLEMDIAQRICAAAAKLPSSSRLREATWDEIFQDVGASDCNPPKPPQASHAPYSVAPPNRGQPTTCPAPGTPPKVCREPKYVEKKFEPAYWKQLLFGETAATVRVYYWPDTKEECDLAEQALRRAYLMHSLGELRSDIGAGIQVADTTARVVFANADDVESVVNFCQDPNIRNAAGIVIAVLGATFLRSSKADELGGSGTPLKGHGIVPDSIKPGSFSIADWSDYPDGIPKPNGPFRLLEGAEYEAARKAANAANAALRKADPAKYAGKQIHEIQPVKFGGSPTDPANKIALTPAEHAKYTSWWNRFMRCIQQ